MCQQSVKCVFNIAFDTLILHEHFIKCAHLCTYSSIYKVTYLYSHVTSFIGGFLCEGNVLKSEINMLYNQNVILNTIQRCHISCMHIRTDILTDAQCEVCFSACMGVWSFKNMVACMPDTSWFWEFTNINPWILFQFNIPRFYFYWWCVDSNFPSFLLC